MKLLLAFLQFGPYHLARLEAARSRCGDAGTEVLGLAMAARQSEYAWQTEAPDTVLCASPETALEEVPASRWPTLLGPILNRVQPDLCAVAGYSHPAMLALIALCGERGIPWILMSDSQEKDEKRHFLVEGIKSRVVRLASSGLVAGQPHLDYLATLGLPPRLCSTGYDVVDNDYFAREAEKWAEPKESQSPPYFLASNRFLPKKNLFRLLDAYARYANATSPNQEQSTKNEERSTPWSLCLLGDGELKSELIDHAAALELTVIEHAPWERGEEMRNGEIGSNRQPPTANRQPPTANRQPPTAHRPPPTAHRHPPTAHRPPPTVFLPGFRQIGELPRFYASAGAFVHASTSEQWGLVVNEAMASGLPVIVSNRCGCAPDLVEEGGNGWTFDPLDVGALADRMTQVSTMSRAEREVLGDASRRIIADWGLDRFAKGLHEAAERAMAVGPKRGSWVDRLLLKGLGRRLG